MLVALDVPSSSDSLSLGADKLRWSLWEAENVIDESIRNNVPTSAVIRTGVRRSARPGQVLQMADALFEQTDDMRHDEPISIASGR